MWCDTQLILYLTAMSYNPDSGEASSVSASDHGFEYGEPGGDNLGSDNDDETQSNAPLGENLRVRSLFSPSRRPHTQRWSTHLG